MSKPTHELFLERMAFDGAHVKDAFNNSGRQRGLHQWLSGADVESTRTEPITKAVAKLIEAVEVIRDKRREVLEGLAEHGDLDHAIIDAVTGPLTELRRLLESGER